MSSTRTTVPHPCARRRPQAFTDLQRESASVEQMANHRVCSSPAWQQSSRFPRVSLTVEKLDEFHADAGQLLTKTMKAYHESNALINPKIWKSVRSRDNLHVFRDRRVSKAKAPAMICVGTMPGRLDEVLEGLHCENTREFCMMQAILSKRFTDGAVLHVVQKRSREEPYSFTGIKWFSTHVPGGRMIADRDLCVFEKVGLVHDQETKRRLGFKLFQSVDIPECPPQSGLVRMKAYVCYVLEEIRPNVLGVYLTGSFDWNGRSLLSRVANPTIAYFLLRVAETSKCLRARKFTERSMAFSGIKKKKRRKCDLCDQWNYSVFHTFESCQGCANSSVCRRCRKMEWMLAPGRKPNGGIAQRPFCTTCIAHVESNSAAKERRIANSRQLARTHGDTTSVTTTAIEEDLDQFTSFVATEGGDSGGANADDCPEIDVLASNRSLSAFTLKVTSQLKEFKFSVDMMSLDLYSPEQSLVRESNSDLELSDHEEEERESELSEAEVEVPILTRDSAEDWRFQTLSIRNPAVVPDTTTSTSTQLTSAERYQQDLYACILRARTIAEATFIATCEQSKVAETMRERTSSRHSYIS